MSNLHYMVQQMTVAAETDINSTPQFRLMVIVRDLLADTHMFDLDMVNEIANNIDFEINEPYTDEELTEFAEPFVKFLTNTAQAYVSNGFTIENFCATTKTMSIKF